MVCIVNDLRCLTAAACDINMIRTGRLFHHSIAVSTFEFELEAVRQRKQSSSWKPCAAFQTAIHAGNLLHRPQAPGEPAKTRCIVLYM